MTRNIASMKSEIEEIKKRLDAREENLAQLQQKVDLNEHEAFLKSLKEDLDQITLYQIAKLEEKLGIKSEEARSASSSTSVDDREEALKSAPGPGNATSSGDTTDKETISQVEGNSPNVGAIESVTVAVLEEEPITSVGGSDEPEESSTASSSTTGAGANTSSDNSGLKTTIDTSGVDLLRAELEKKIKQKEQLKKLTEEGLKGDEFKSLAIELTREYIYQLQKDLIFCMGELHELQEQNIGPLRQDIIAKNQKIDQLTQELTTKDQDMARQVKDLNLVILAKDGKITDRDRKIFIMEQTITDRNTRIFIMEQTITDRDTKIFTRDKTITDKTKELDDKTKELISAKRELTSAKRSKQIVKVVLSVVIIIGMILLCKDKLPKKYTEKFDAFTGKISSWALDKIGIKSVSFSDKLPNDIITSSVLNRSSYPIRQSEIN